MRDLAILPSILASDFSQLRSEVQAVAPYSQGLHLDVMDGHFVPNITFGPKLITALRPLTEKVFDVHLMITPVEPYLEIFAQAGSDILTLHIESTPHVHRALEKIRGLGKRAGLSFNPGTSLEALPYLLDKVDLVLIMTVNPGFSGQAFLPSMLDKIRQAREYIKDRPILLEVDGGIGLSTIGATYAAGADHFVAGASVFHGPAEKYGQNIQDLRSAALGQRA